MDITEAPDTPVEGSTLAWVVDVPMGKGQVYRYELMVDGRARIYKSPLASEPSYDIVDGICSCPAGYHSKECKHIKPIIGFRGARVLTSD
jgi:hypothetical protein